MTVLVRYVEVPLVSIRGKVVRNPNYNSNTLSNGWCWIPIPNNPKPLMAEALEDSIRAEGVRNPIVCCNLVEGIYLQFGGSRLRAARNLGLHTIPALVNDFCGSYVGSPIVTSDNYREFFTDPPAYFEIGPDGVDTHYSLERNRRHTHDPAGLAWADPDAEFIKEEFSWLK